MSQCKEFRHSSLLLFLLVLPSISHAGQQAQFNSQFLRLGSKKAPGAELDTRRFRTGNPLTAGQYPSDIYINEQLVGHGNIRLAADASGNVAPCVDADLLSLSRYRQSAIATTVQQALAHPGACLSPEQLDSEITWQYDVSEMALHMSIPQSKQQKTNTTDTDPAHWNWGEPVAYLDYSANLYGSDSQQSHFSSRYLGLQAGVNLGAWRFHHHSSLQQSDGSQHWQTLSAYGERSLPTWRSRLRVGQGWTSGALFDSVSYQGLELASDERMLPESQRGYAPTVFGIARTYAHVKIEQNGYLLYETSVAPGSFAIDDLSPTGYGGDLTITITESDGSITRYSVPFATTPGLIRVDNTRYTATVGQLRESQQSDKPLLGQATVQHGLTNQLSVYSGMSLMQGYNAELLGAGLNTPIGAFSLDMTYSSLQGSSRTLQGQSWRAIYSKQFAASHTNLSLASYRYSSDDYRSLREAIEARDAEARHQVPDQPHTQQRLDLTLSQPMGEGNVYFTGSRTHYWHQPHSDTSWQLGYSNHMGEIDYQISGQRLHTSDGHQDNQVTLNLSMPLGESRSQSLDLQLTHSQQGGNQLQAALGGTLGEQDEYSYGVTASQMAPKTGEAITGVGLNSSYRSHMATVSGTYSRDSQHQQQYSAGIQGALLAHDSTITALPHLGETFAIVDAPQAAGATIKGHPELSVDEQGYAVVPDLIPYTSNQIELDPEGIQGDSELSSSSQWVIPDAGAATRLHFATHSGMPVIFKLRVPQQGAVPLGAIAEDSSGAQLGIVGQGGKLYARMAQPSGIIHLDWQNRHCQFHYQLPNKQPGLLTQTPHLECQP